MKNIYGYALFQRVSAGVLNSWKYQIFTNIFCGLLPVTRGGEPIAGPGSESFLVSAYTAKSELHTMTRQIEMRHNDVKGKTQVDAESSIILITIYYYTAKVALTCIITFNSFYLTDSVARDVSYLIISSTRYATQCNFITSKIKRFGSLFLLRYGGECVAVFLQLRIFKDRSSVIE